MKLTIRHPRRFSGIYICLLVIALFSRTSISQAFSGQDPVNRYLVTSYAPSDYGFGTQNWDFVQDRNGIIYVANRNGVLQFDGSTWNLIPVSGETPLRSLAIDETGRIFVGAVGEFGYLSTGSIGQTVYRSLSDSLDLVIADVWETHVSKYGVYFATRNVIFRYYEGKITEIRPERGFLRSFKAHGEVIVYKPGNGMVRLEADSFTVLPGTESLSGTNISNVLEAPEMFGSSKGVYLLAGNSSSYHYGLDTGRLTRLRARDGGSDFSFPSESYKSIKLRNGNYAFATLSSGVYITDSQFRVLHNIDRDAGLRVDMSLSVFEDKHGSIWVGLNNGISRIEMPEYISFWNETSGVQGSVLSIYQFQNNLFVGTSNSLLKKSMETGFENAAFEQISSLSKQFWDMKSLRIDGREVLFVATSDGLHYYYNNQLGQIDRLQVFAITVSDIRPNRLYLGHRDGWSILEIGSVSRNGINARVFENFKNPPFEIRKIIENPDGSLWLGSRFNGLIKIDSLSAWSVDKSVVDTALFDRYNTDSGLPNDHSNIPYLLENRLIVSTADGIYRPLESAQGLRFVPDEKFSFEAESRYINALYPVSSDSLWLVVGSRLALLKVRENSDPLFDIGFTKMLPESPISSLFQTKGDQLWVGGSDGLYRLTLSKRPEFEVEYKALVRAVYLQQDSLIYAGTTDSERLLILEYGQTDITIQFAAARFIYSSPLRYQSMLEGYDRVWSNWSGETRRTYTNLPNGNYTFKVRAIDAFGVESIVGELEVQVLTPWFLSFWAYLGYFLSILLFAYMLVKLYTRRIRQRNVELERKVALRTTDLQVEKRRLENMNQNLRALDENRDKFLSVVAHDLRNPLMIIRSSSDLIVEEIEDKEAVLEFAKYINDAALRMQFIIENLLEDRAKKIRSVEEIDIVDIKKVIIKLCDENRIWLDRKNIELSLDLNDNCLVNGDPAQISVIVDNLISNAIKYTFIGKAIHIRLEQVDQSVKLSIKDGGKGLTPGDFRDLGKPFKTLSAKPTGGESSSGMGLSIVKDLLKTTNGELHVVSHGDMQGSTFTVVFRNLVSEQQD